MAIQPIVQKEKTIIEPKTGEKPIIKVEPPQDVYEQEKAIIRGRQVIWHIWLTIEAILFLRFLLLVLAANPRSLFSIIVGMLAFPLTFLFAGLFQPLVIANIELDWNIIFAMLVYTAIAGIISLFFRITKPIDPKEAEEKVEQPIV